MNNVRVTQLAESAPCKRVVGGSSPSAGTKILTAHQSMFLPWCGLIAKIASADVFVAFDEVPFERHGFGNRNLIKTHSGAQMLTVPVRLDNHLDKPISQIEIVSGNWKRKHLRTIELAYAKAPYFDRLYPALQAIYAMEFQYLAQFNMRLLDWMLEEVGISVPIVDVSTLKLQGSKSDLVLDMCLKMGASEYIFGELGTDYANVEKFYHAGVSCRFQQYRQVEYPQLHGAFVPNLSALDVMMNCGPDSLKVIMAGHEG